MPLMYTFDKSMHPYLISYESVHSLLTTVWDTAIPVLCCLHLEMAMWNGVLAELVRVAESRCFVLDAIF